MGAPTIRYEGIGWGHPLSGTKDWMGPPTLRYQGNVDGPFRPPDPILIGTIDAMSIYETPSGRLSSDAPLFRRPGNRKRPPASMNLPGGAQQRTAQTTGAKQSRARSLVVF